MYILPRKGASSCNFYISQLEQFIQIYIPLVHIGILRGKNFNQSNHDMQIYNSPREGGNSCGESLNQSKLSILNLFTTSSHVTSSSREGVVIESNQSEAAELHSVKNIHKSLSPTINLNLISSNKIKKKCNNPKIPEKTHE